MSSEGEPEEEDGLQLESQEEIISSSVLLESVTIDVKPTDLLPHSTENVNIPIRNDFRSEFLHSVLPGSTPDLEFNSQPPTPGKLSDLNGDDDDCASSVSSSSSVNDESSDAVLAEDVSTVPFLEGNMTPLRAPNHIPSDENEVSHERKYHDQDTSDPSWFQHKKHFFILSAAGKPIYCRYGDEQNMVSFFGLLQAIISFVYATNDVLSHLRAGDHTFVFLLRDPLYFVCIAATNEPVNSLRTQLEHLYLQVLCFLTGSAVRDLFISKPHFDLRSLLFGTEKVLDGFVHAMNTNPSVLMEAIPCLPLRSSTRDELEKIMFKQRSKHLMYSLLISGHQLVHLVRSHRAPLHPSDLQIILNFVSTNTSLHSSDAWTPLCLPNFNDKGFLHACISYIKPQLCLVLISSRIEAFYPLLRRKNSIVEEMEEKALFTQLDDSISHRVYTLSEIGVGHPHLRHFVYKTMSTAQFVSPAMEPPYRTKAAQKRLFRLYARIQQRMESQSPLWTGMYFQRSSWESVLGWKTNGFFMLAAFSPTIPKRMAIDHCSVLLQWLKQNEDVVFIVTVLQY